MLPPWGRCRGATEGGLSPAKLNRHRLDSPHDRRPSPDPGPRRAHGDLSGHGRRQPVGALCRDHRGQRPVAGDRRRPGRRRERGLRRRRPQMPPHRPGGEIRRDQGRRLRHLPARAAHPLDLRGVRAGDRGGVWVAGGAVGVGVRFTVTFGLRHRSPQAVRLINWDVERFMQRMLSRLSHHKL